MTDRFVILFVCTGNLCRSVIAERLGRRQIHDQPGAGARAFTVVSAGTAARDGAPMHPDTARVLAALGADTAGFRSRALTAADIEDADLVLPVAQEHRDAAMVLRPRASGRIYLLREFARLAAYVPPPGKPGCPVANARLAVSQAARLRGRIPYVDPADDEIVDPAAGHAAVLDCARAIGQAVHGVLSVLCGPRTVPDHAPGPGP